MATENKASTGGKLNLSHQVLRHISQKIKDGTLKKGDKLPTNRELVAELGVSILTVQRSMKQLEAQGVLSCRRRLGTFLENPKAMSSPKIQSGLIGLFTPEIFSDFHADLLIELEDNMMNEGKLVSINFTHSKPDREVILLRSLARQRLESLVYFTSPLVVISESHCRKVSDWIERYIEEGTFVLFADICPPGFESRLISLDNEKATEMLTNKLIQQGHEKIAFVGARHLPTNEARYQGYKIAMEKADFIVDDECFIDVHIIESEDWEDRVEADVRSLMKKHPEITGFVVDNGPSAIRVQKVLSEMDGLSFTVKDSIASLFEVNEPPFEAAAWIQIPGKEMGQIASELLMEDHPANYEPGHIKIRPKFWLKE
jgi:GntR family transcriptional regulator, arabinose operon transcriptional repressor